MVIHNDHFDNALDAEAFLEKKYEQIHALLPTESKKLTVSTPDTKAYFEKMLNHDLYKEEGMAEASLATFKETAGSFESLTNIYDFDEQWSADASTSVERVSTEDGTIGYYKSVLINCQEQTGISEFGGSSLKNVINEVRASNFAEALKLESVIPSTYFIKDDEGDFGTFQEEVSGHIDTTLNRSNLKRVKEEDLKKARLFDFIVGSGDRHNDNYLVYKEGKDYRLALIDNGYSFPTKENFYCNDSDIVGTDFNDHLPIKYKDNDFQSLREFKETKDFGGLSKQFTEAEKRGVLQRIDYVLKHKTVPCFEEYFKTNA